MTNWAKRSPPCHIIGLKYCFCTCMCCFSSPYLKQLNKKYPVAYRWQPYISANTSLLAEKSPDTCVICGQESASARIMNNAVCEMTPWTYSKCFCFCFSFLLLSYMVQTYHISGAFFVIHFCLF